MDSEIPSAVTDLAVGLTTRKVAAHASDVGTDWHMTGGELARAGVRIGSAGLGGYLSTVFGPEAGASVAQSVSEAGEAVVGFLEQRSKERVTATFQRLSTEVAERVQSGERVRGDHTDPDSEEAAAVFEAAVQAAARSAEERKCEVVANLYASIAFDRSVSVADALLLFRRVDESSWRQLVALQYFSAKDRQRERESISVAGSEGHAQIRWVLEAELSELGRGLELVGFVQKDGAVANPSSTFGGGQIVASSFSKVGPTGLGRTLARLGRLADVVTDEDFDSLRNDLGGEGKGSS
jgi:hypothetical protein